MDKKQITEELYYRSCHMIERLYDNPDLFQDTRLVNRVYLFHYRMVKRLYRYYPYDQIALYRMP